MKRMHLPRLVAVALALTACQGASPAAVAQITIDPQQRFQTISGWEVTTRLWEQNKDEDRYDPTWLDSRDEIVRRLVDEAGVNRLRMELRSGMENPTDHWAQFAAGRLTYRQFRSRYYEKINDDSDPRTFNASGFQFSQLDYFAQNLMLPMRERLAARGERLYVNLCFVDFRHASSGNVEHAQAPEEYAELVLAAFTHLRDRYGVVPDALEIILEPENTHHWGGEQIGRALVAAERRLAENGFRPEFIAPSTTHARNAPRYIDDMMRVPGAAERVSTFSYHNYDNPPDSVREAIRSRARDAGVSTAMLEHLPSDAAELLRDLSAGNVSAWQQYGVAHLDTPARNAQGAYLLLVDPGRPAGERVRMASRTEGLAQIFRNVRSGAVRIASRSANNAFRTVAFVNPDGGQVVAIVSDRGGEVQISGLAPGTYDISFAPEGGRGRDLPAATLASGEPLSLRIPGRGVLAARQRPG